MNFEGMAASDISDWLLDRTGRAMMAGDFHTFADCFAIPHYIGTFEGQQVLHTLADLRVLFEKVRSHYLSQGVTELVRNCIEADWERPGRIKATNVSRLIRDAELVQRPYPILSELGFLDGTWKVLRSEYAISDAPVHSALMSGQAVANGSVQ